MGHDNDPVSQDTTLSSPYPVPDNPVVELSPQVMKQLHSSHISANNAVYLDLAQTLLKWRVPLYAFDDIIAWLKRSVGKPDFDPKGRLKSFKSFMRRLKRTMNANSPIPVTVPLEWGARNVNPNGVEESQFPSRSINVITFTQPGPCTTRSSRLSVSTFSVPFLRNLPPPWCSNFLRLFQGLPSLPPPLLLFPPPFPTPLPTQFPKKDPRQPASKAMSTLNSAPKAASLIATV